MDEDGTHRTDAAKAGEREMTAAAAETRVSTDARADSATPIARPGGRIPGWVPYTTFRILFFVVPLVLVYGFGRNLLLSGVVATLVGLCLSVIFLNRQRGALAVDIDALSRGGRRPQAPPTDESVEDAELGTASAESAVRGTAPQSAKTSANPTP